jgi:hypothetical protein
MAGCGGDDDGASEPSATAEGGTARTAPPPVRPGPAPVGQTPRARTTLKTASAACGGQTPTAVIDRYASEVRTDGSTVDRALLRSLTTAVERLADSPSRSVAYPQLAARVYALSLPQAERGDGLRGCLYELRREVD